MTETLPSCDKCGLELAHMEGDLFYCPDCQADKILSRTESACAWFDSLPPWACVICGKDAETCEHYEEPRL